MNYYEAMLKKSIFVTLSAPQTQGGQLWAVDLGGSTSALPNFFLLLQAKRQEHGGRWLISRSLTHP